MSFLRFSLMGAGFSVSSPQWFLPALCSLAVIYVSFLAMSASKSRARRSELAALASRRVTVRDEKRAKLIAQLKSYEATSATLTPAAQREIVSLSALELATALRKRVYSYQDVMCTFCLRAADLGASHNAITEDLYDTAMAEAAALDAAAVSAGPDEDADDATLAREGRLLRGVPVSIKDCLMLKGADNTMGLACRCFKPCTEDSLFVTLLRSQGAIPFVRGNVPQALMLPETDNNVWGRATNPWNPTRTPGGSSGGDGALVALRAAPLAIGTDIGGSVRIPAHYCGIFGFKPTPQRFTHHGTTAPRPRNIDGQQLVKATAGPLAHTASDLVAVVRAWLQPQMWRSDPTVAPVPFNEALFMGAATKVADTVTPSPSAGASAGGSSSGSGSGSKRLRVGFYVHDGWAAPAPTAARAVAEAVAALRAAGHECVPFTPPRTDDAAALYLALMSADGHMAGFKEGLEGEALHPAYRSVEIMADLPAPVRAVAAAAAAVAGQKRGARLLRAVKPKTAKEHWDDCVQFVEYNATFTAAWEAAGLDAVVCPGNVVAAVAHGNSKDILPVFTHTFLWNMVHYPVASAPITTVREGETDLFCAPEQGGAPAGERDMFAQATAAAVKGSEGMPYGVQIAARPFHDEVCLRLLLELERAGVAKARLPPVCADLAK